VPIKRAIAKFTNFWTDFLLRKNTNKNLNTKHKFLIRKMCLENFSEINTKEEKQAQYWTIIMTAYKTAFSRLNGLKTLTQNYIAIQFLLNFVWFYCCCHSR